MSSSSSSLAGSAVVSSVTTVEEAAIANTLGLARYPYTLSGPSNMWSAAMDAAMRFL